MSMLQVHYAVTKYFLLYHTYWPTRLSAQFYIQNIALLNNEILDKNHPTLVKYDKNTFLRPLKLFNPFKTPLWLFHRFISLF